MSELPVAPARLVLPIRWQIASLLLPLAVFAGLAWRVTSRPPPPRLETGADAQDRRFGLSLARRQELFFDISSHDAEWKLTASRFGDEWSRHDDYHVHLARHVAALAARHSLAVEVVFLIYDEGVHRQWTDATHPPLEPTWAPLQPRKQ